MKETADKKTETKQFLYSKNTMGLGQNQFYTFHQQPNKQPASIMSNTKQ